MESLAKPIPAIPQFPNNTDEGLKGVLFENAGFRHVFRHSCLTGIKWNRLKPLCTQLPGLHQKIKTNVHKFFSSLEASIRKNHKFGIVSL